MNIDTDKYPWPKDASAAVELQKELSRLICLEGDLSGCDLIAGADCASVGGVDLIAGAVVVWHKSRNQIIAQSTVVIKPDMPYITGLLAFRELPALLAAFKELPITPEVVIVDGQGLAHPRRLGIASHLGLYLGIPSIGCGKTRLIGSFTMPSEVKGSRSPLFHRNEHIGYVLRTRTKVKPVFISPGHQCSIEAAADIVLECCVSTRLPEPIRAAHRLSGQTLKL
ncbi:MAG: endonuclease V [Calditrichota bacterium]